MQQIPAEVWTSLQIEFLKKSNIVLFDNIFVKVRAETLIRVNFKSLYCILGKRQKYLILSLMKVSVA